MAHHSLTASVLVLLIAAGCAGAPKNRRVSPDGPQPLGPAPTSLGDGTGETSEAPEDAGEAEPGSAASRADATDGGAGAPQEEGPATDVAEAAPTAPTGEPSGTGNVSWPRTEDDAGATGSVTIATVGGKAIDLRDLVSKWMLRDPNGVRGVLDDLLLSQIVAFESAALRIELPPGAIDAKVKRSIRALGEQASAAGAPDLDAFVRSRLGLEPKVLVAELEREAAVDLLAPRCVRAWLLSNEHREIRAIAVTDDAGSKEVQARLARGEAFADVARDLSVDVSKEDGGRMPPVVRGEQPISRTAFATDVGGVAGPIKDGQGFVFVAVEAAPTPLEGGWEDIGEAVEASIAERDVDDVEFWQWKDAMYTRYEIDITPFLDLAGR